MGPQGWCGRVRKKNLPFTGIRSPYSPARSQSLNRLSYPGPLESSLIINRRIGQTLFFLILTVRCPSGVLFKRRRSPGKRLECKVDNSQSYKADVNSERSYISSPSIRLNVVDTAADVNSERSYISSPSIRLIYIFTHAHFCV